MADVNINADVLRAAIEAGVTVALTMLQQENKAGVSTPAASSRKRPNQAAIDQAINRRYDRFKNKKAQR